MDFSRKRRFTRNRCSLSVSLKKKFVFLNQFLFFNSSLTGEGNFNWRFIFDFDYIAIEEKIVLENDSVFQIGKTVKKFPPRIVIRVYDFDLISSDDFLGLL
jgi:hypothetical protein